MILRLLIAEDELWLRKRLVSTIDWSSYGISEVYEAEDGGEALEIALRSSMPFWKRQESCVYLLNISSRILSREGRSRSWTGRISVRRRHWRSVRTEGSKYRSLTALCLF